uniref:Uncharacterized protein n=1 Tax=Anguilla anguilla TaxID=7936 RepID=A0A0E9RW56_ANGAN
MCIAIVMLVSNSSYQSHFLFAKLGN